MGGAGKSPSRPGRKGVSGRPHHESLKVLFLSSPKEGGDAAARRKVKPAYGSIHDPPGYTRAGF